MTTKYWLCSLLSLFTVVYGKKNINVLVFDWFRAVPTDWNVHIRQWWRQQRLRISCRSLLTTVQLPLHQLLQFELRRTGLFWGSFSFTPEKISSKCNYEYKCISYRRTTMTPSTTQTTTDQVNTIFRPMPPTTNHQACSDCGGHEERVIRIGMAAIMVLTGDVSLTNVDCWLCYLRRNTGCTTYEFVQ